MSDDPSTKTPTPPARVLLPRLLARFAPHRWQLLLAAATLLLVTGVHLARPLILRSIIDVAIPRADLGHALKAAGLFVLCLLVGGGALYLQLLVMARVGSTIVAGIKRELFRHVIGQGLRFFDRHKVGTLLTRSESDVDQMKALFTQAAAQLFTSSVMMIGMIGIILWEQPRFGIWAALALPPVAALMYGYVSYIRDLYRQVRERSSEITGYVAEYLQGMPLIQLYGRESAVAARLHRLNLGKYLLERKTMVVDYVIFWPTFNFLTETVAVIAIFIYGSNQIMAGAMSVGTLVLFLELLRQVMMPIRELVFVVASLQSALAASGRVFEILDTPSDVLEAALAGASPAVDPAGAVGTTGAAAVAAAADPVEVAGPPGAAPASPAGPGFAGSVATDPGPGGGSSAPGPLLDRCPGLQQALTFDEVGFAYRDTPVLHGIGFTVRRGEHVAIVGASGSGKTTCINLLLRFYDPTSGYIRLDGVDIRRYRLTDWRANLALVLQEVFLFPGTIMENLKGFDDRITDAQVMAAAEAVGAHEFIVGRPDGYQTRLSERGANFSQGERQLLSYARAMVRNPELLILDEATSAIDVITERLLQDSMSRLMAGRTAIVIAHRLSTIRAADQILVFAGGRIVERGRHPELMAIPGGVYRQLAEIQAVAGSDDGETVGETVGPAAVGEAG